jgi:hypothetical protein
LKAHDVGVQIGRPPQPLKYDGHFETGWFGTLRRSPKWARALTGPSLPIDRPLHRYATEWSGWRGSWQRAGTRPCSLRRDQEGDVYERSTATAPVTGRANISGQALA